MILQTLLELYFLSKTVTLILDVCLIGGEQIAYSEYSVVCSFWTQIQPKRNMYFL